MAAAKRIHVLVDQLSDLEREALVDFLERLCAEVDPLERAFMRASLLGREELSPEAEDLLREAEAALAAGCVLPRAD